jgi:beta-glucosidase
VWHSQVPRWVFQDADGKPLTRDALLERMHDHIRTVVGRYKGRINGWDVVNEALNEDGTMRQSQWYKIIGPDFIEKAFQYAHEADPNAQIYYNDYSLENEAKRKGAVELMRKLKADGVPITGIGLQGHLHLDDADAKTEAATIETFSSLGLQVNVSEMDIDILPRTTRSNSADVSLTAAGTADSNPYVNGLPDEMQQKLAKRYAELFQVYVDHHASMGRITLWGVTDGGSWLNNFPTRGRTNYPLLFDRQGKAKPAFTAVLQVGETAQKGASGKKQPAKKSTKQSNSLPYQNPALPPEQRAADLVSRMTLEEKLRQMQNSAPAIPRLGVPVYNWWNEALHGVASGRATVFPEPIGLGATWDAGLVHRVADAISTEARAKYHEALRHDPIPEPASGNSPGRVAGLTYWSPNLNIFRDPRWGRGQETYGEDPYLTSRMGVAFVTGLQGNDPHYLKVVATPKHYAVHSGPEPLRHVFDAKASEYDLLNTYLPAFRAAVVEGKADSVMCVYNSVNGEPGCANDYLLKKELRDEWGFKGFVVSDCGAVGDIYRSHKFVATEGAAAVAAVKAGTDLTCGGEYMSMVDEVKAGHITEAEITRAAERLFVARFRLGMFDPQDRVPYAKIPYSENDSAQHRELARTAGREGIVLLKNQDRILPLKSSLNKIAVIGPSADDPIGLLGNYNGISSKQVTPLEGIVRQFPKAKVQYALGATYTATTNALVSSDRLTPPDGKGPGLLAEYFDNPDFRGQPTLHRTEPRVYFDANMEEPAVVTAVHGDQYSIRWTGTFTPPDTGDYVLTARTGQWNRNGKIKLFLDDKEVNPSGPAGARPAGLGPGQGQGGGPGGRRAGSPPIRLEAGHHYAVRVEYQQNGSGGGAELNWLPPASAMLAEAEKTAKEADVAVVFVGLNGTQEGEGHDRAAIELPEPQETLVKTIIATGKPVVVILTSGSAVAVNSAASGAAAVLSAWYAGEEAGTAIAETLAGVNNPSGRLPVTFYKSTDQLPSFSDYAMKGRTYRYFTGEVLYPFGYGLSYSTFAYSGLTAKRTANGAEVRATVKNTSSREGDEVVQLYLGGGTGDDAPTRSLRGFQRIHLAAGQVQQLTFTVAAGDLPKSTVEVSVGGGQPLGSTPCVKGSL